MDSYESPVSSECKGKTPESSPVPKMSNKGDNKDHILPELLSALGLKDLHGGRLTLSSVLEINTLSEEPIKNMAQLPFNFLKKLMVSNLNARNIKCEDDQSELVNDFSLSTFDDEMLSNDGFHFINPLDLITALFYCSDPFLQQEIVSKMSMCQFAVPLLLPNCDTQQSTLMLWAMRDLVKKYSPHSIAGVKGFVEDSVVTLDIPMVSFVRLGDSSLPKSQILNKLLSNPNQQNETFVHRDMECGDVARKISDGLVEISWYLPSGIANIDMFTQPVAIANLRGDCKLFKTEMSFLCETSAAVFIFCDDLKNDLHILSGSKAELFLITNSQCKSFNITALRDFCKSSFKDKNVIIKKRQNEAEFMKILRQHLSGLIENNPQTIKVEDMAAVASAMGIQVDEDKDDCVVGRQKAELITKTINDLLKFKQDQLPLHGNIWKEISQLEKEKCRLKNADREQSIEHYKSSLVSKEKQLREKQRQTEMSGVMVMFIDAISQKARLYFLKWMKIQLDNLSRHTLSKLREKYKNCCKITPCNKEEIARLDEQISKCSLGSEHFFRELGQIYESACSLQENDPVRKQVQHLPALCAQILLDGFPVELVDGDSSNIPVKWISEVLAQLHKLMRDKSTILVLTVLGAQGTGKSTLLNTMFGVQFAVSSGRCTRGAFMLLIKISEKLRPELKCDFIMVLDTEGLKSLEVATIDTSHEHDNELATLVIGLSDITIINVAMENSTEMKDILQIVVHAFLRMTEVGKRRRCLFVHQNVADISAHQSNIRDRKKLVQQLNEMTQAAAKMEKRAASIKFTDVMEYDPEKDSYYIPGLWHGTPPMAPVNAGYTEAICKLKKDLIGSLKSSENIALNNVPQFCIWTESLWKAVKCENFIFHFRNSLVADAYTDLCIEYNKWEWTFQKEMKNWLITKETVITNFGVTEKNVQINILRNKLKEMLNEASEKLESERQNILTHLDNYFKKKDSRVILVEKYRREFQICTANLTTQTESSIRQSLENAIEIRVAMEKVNKIKEEQIDTIEKKVRQLLQDCRERKADLTECDLTREFEEMWAEIMAELSEVRLPETDVYLNVLHLLWENFQVRGGKFTQMLNKVNLKILGQDKFVVSSDWISGLTFTAKRTLNAIKHMDWNHLIAKMQTICDNIINKCEGLVSNNLSTMMKNNTDYHDTYIKEILNTIDKKQKDHEITDECEANLKFHICGYAARLFEEAHKKFIVKHDPQKRLMEYKAIFLEKFKELFNEKDHCQKKAAEFTQIFIKPAVHDYVSEHLGEVIAEEMRRDYCTKTHMQFSLLKDLLQANSFQMYMDYVVSYETYVKKWLNQQIIKRMSEGGMLPQLKKKIQCEIVEELIKVVNISSKTGDIQVFIQEFCQHLEKQFVFPKDALDTFLSLSEAKANEFAKNLIEFVREMEKSLALGYDEITGIPYITHETENLPSKPNEILFSRLYMCGQQCPFCGIPCEAEGQGHRLHFANMHRPNGFGFRSWIDSKKLLTDICTSLVLSKSQFKPDATIDKWHRYDEYDKIYPNWSINGNQSSEASGYWEYVLMKFNREFAEAFSAEPADIPHEWKALTEEDALNSLKISFNIQ